MVFCRVDKECFTFKEGCAGTANVVIENLSDSNVTYKMKTNDSQRFAVRPNPCIVNVGQSEEISISYNGEPPGDGKMPHFRLYAAEIDDDDSDLLEFWTRRKEARKLGSKDAEEVYDFFTEFTSELPAHMALSASLPPPPMEAGPGVYWQSIPGMTDHFGGRTADFLEKWETNNPLWLGRQPSFFRSDNISHDRNNRCVYLKARHDQPENVRDRELHQRLMNANKGRRQYHTYSTSFMRTRETQLYGYFEARVLLAKSDISSAFWLKLDIPGSWDTEIDVFEFSTSTQKQWDQSKIVNTNHHLLAKADGSKGVHNKGVEIHYDYDLSSRPHTFGVEWTKKSIRWFVEGKEVRRVDGHPYHLPMHVQFDRESFPDWFGLPKPSSMRVPDRFTIYWVRSWKRAR